jgi:hypothetical protein
MMLGVLFVFNKSTKELEPFATTSEEPTVEREVRLRNLGLYGKKLKQRMKSGAREARRVRGTSHSRGDNQGRETSHLK